MIPLRNEEEVKRAIATLNAALDREQNKQTICVNLWSFQGYEGQVEGPMDQVVDFVLDVHGPDTWFSLVTPGSAKTTGFFSGHSGQTDTCCIQHLTDDARAEYHGRMEMHEAV